MLNASRAKALLGAAGALVIVLAAPARAQSGLSAFVQVWYSGQTPTQPIRDQDNQTTGMARSYTYGRYGRDDWDIRTAFLGEATASASYGVLSAYARADLRQDDYVWATYHLVNATATFEDTLTISADSLGSGYVVYSVQVSGFATGPFDRGEAVGGVRVQHAGFFDSLTSQCTTSQLLCSAPYPVTFGKPFALRLSLDAYVSIVSGSYPYRGAGIADFSKRAELVGIQVLDAFGDPVRDYAIKSASGTAYPVPEPSGAVALLAGMLSLEAWRRVSRELGRAGVDGPRPRPE